MDRRVYRNKEWLESKYLGEEKTTTEIAKEANCAKETIRKWLHKHDIPVRGPSERKRGKYVMDGPHKDEYWLREKYIDEELSIKEISHLAGVSKGTINNHLDKFDIEKRKQGYKPESIGSTFYKLNNEEWLREEYKDKEKSMRQIAKEIGATGPIIKYWLDKYGIERRNDGYEWKDSDTEFQRDPNWDSKRKKRLKIDSHQCQDCGLHEENHWRSLDVHHLTPKKEFVDEDGNVDWESANDLDNLVSLCQSCHNKRHRTV